MFGLYSPTRSRIETPSGKQIIDATSKYALVGQQPVARTYGVKGRLHFFRIGRLRDTRH
jgi:hypothetical protein